MLRHQKKKKGFLLIEGILMLALMTAVAFGMVSIMAGQFSTLSASKEANQAQQLAEYIASQLRQDGYENVEDFDMQESPKSADDFVGNSDLKGKYLYTVKKLSDFEVKEDSYNKVKLMEVKIYPTGYSNVPIYSLEVPLSSQAWAIPVGAIMAWPAEETPTSGGVWLECNGQAIDTKYTRLRELVGDHTPNYQGVFLRGYGSQKANVIYSRNHLGGDNNLPNLVQTFHSDSLGKIQTDSIRPNVGAFTDILSVDSGGTNYWNNLYNYPIWGGDWYKSVYDGYSDYNIASDGGMVDAAAGVVKNGGWSDELYFLNHPPKKYSLDGDSESGYNLIEKNDDDLGYYVKVHVNCIGYRTDIGIPDATEIRPINIAVRYFIKAR